MAQEELVPIDVGAAGPPETPGPARPDGEQLTGRELEVLTLITHGLSNKEIASATYLGVNSVKTYIRTAYRKIGATRRVRRP